MKLFSELRRRNVLRMVVLYVVAAWLIMQVAEVLIGLAKLPDWVGTATLGLLAVGFPIALILSWFYELTPEGMKLEKDVDAAESITHVTGRRLDFVVISLLSAAVILFAWHTWWTSSPPEQSIAVLPFENMSDDPDNEYFSDGISEELLNLLAGMPQLTVISSSSSFSFKDKDLDTPTIAEQLNVAYVLEGAVRKVGNRVRITAQLIDARSDSHLWSETYDRKLENIFALQDEISGAIVGALKERLQLEVEAVPRVITAASTEAHDAYLRGRYLVVQRTPSSIEGAIREYEKAISLDPDYALAHAELSIAIVLMARYTGQNRTAAIARAVPHAERAMDLDPNLAEASAATGFLLHRQGSDEDAQTHIRRAIQINPNYSWAYVIEAQSLMRLGRYAEHMVTLETAVRLDPLSIPARTSYVVGLITRNRLDEAERELEKLASTAPVHYKLYRSDLNAQGAEWANGMLDSLDAWRIDPTIVFSRGGLSPGLAYLGLESEALAIPDVSPIYALLYMGRHADAAEAMLADNPASIYERGRLGWALAAAGDYARARPILEEMWQRSGGRVASSGVFRPDYAVALIAIRRDAGEEAGVGELLAAMRDDVRRLREAGVTRDGFTDYKDGLVTYLAGERTRGLALLTKAMEQGDFNPPRMAYLQTLYDDPGYAPIAAIEETLKARERSRFLAVVCTDNPYEAVWRPAAETCEQFAAADRN